MGIIEPETLTFPEPSLLRTEFVPNVRLFLITTFDETSTLNPAGVVSGPVTLVAARVVLPETSRVPEAVTAPSVDTPVTPSVPDAVIVERFEFPDTVKVPPSTMLVKPKLVAFMTVVFIVVALTVVALRLPDVPFAVRVPTLRRPAE